MSLTTLLVIVGRVLLGGYFLQSGVRNIPHFGLHTGILRGKRVPLPEVALTIGMALEILGGASVLLGLFPSWGAVALIIFTVLANVLYHNFTQFSGEERTSHLNSALTNLGLIGGLLLVVAIG